MLIFKLIALVVYLLSGILRILMFLRIWNTLRIRPYVIIINGLLNRNRKMLIPMSYVMLLIMVLVYFKALVILLAASKSIPVCIKFERKRERTYTLYPKYPDTLQD